VGEGARGMTITIGAPTPGQTTFYVTNQAGVDEDVRDLGARALAAWDRIFAQYGLPIA
jgi:hypothetical protein